MAAYGKSYELNMVFRMRLMTEPKGNPRPTVYAIDWNQNKFNTDQFHKIIAIGSIGRTRIYAQVEDDAVGDRKWKMMFNIHHPSPTRSKAIQWHPINWKILAIGTDDGRNMTIDLIHWNEDKFRKFNRIEVPTSHKLGSICWQNSGSYLLATLNSIEDRERSKMVVIKDPIKADCIKSIVDTGYKGSFFATFPPFCDYILSCSEDVGAIWLWILNESNEWNKCSSIRIAPGISRMSFNEDGSLLAGIGEKLRIWKCEIDTNAEAQTRLKLINIDKIELNDNQTRRRGASLKEHCDNLYSIFVCRNDMILTGSAIGSMCLHGVSIEDSTKRERAPYKVLAFQWCDVQFMYPQGEITCVNALVKESLFVASGGTDGIVTIWQVLPGERPQIERNPNLEKYFYEPKHQSLDDSVNLDVDDAETVLSTDTEKNDELELLLTVKAELGELKLKQNKLMKMIEEADDAMTLGLKVLQHVAKDLQKARIESNQINTSVAQITQVLSLGQ